MAFGGAYITMNSKDCGADLYLAWTRAELGIIGGERATGLVHRRALAAAADAVRSIRGSPAGLAGRDTHVVRTVALRLRDRY